MYKLTSRANCFTATVHILPDDFCDSSSSYSSERFLLLFQNETPSHAATPSASERNSFTSSDPFSFITVHTSRSEHEHISIQPQLSSAISTIHCSYTGHQEHRAPRTRLLLKGPRTNATRICQDRVSPTHFRTRARSTALHLKS